METRDVRYIGSLDGVRNEWGRFPKGEPVAVPTAAAELLTIQKYFEYADGASGVETSLGDRNFEKLREIAADLEIEGRSGMKKAELIEAIESAQTEGGSS